MVNVNSSISSSVAVTYASAYTTPQNTGNVRITTRNATNPLITIASPSFGIALNSTSLPETQDNDVVRGEAISLVAFFTLPQGTTPNAKLQFTLPTLATGGYLVVVLAHVAKMESNMQSTTNPASLHFVDFDGDGFDDKATFDFGTITNIPDMVTEGDNDTIKVEILAVVGHNNTNGTLLNSTASFNYGFTSALGGDGK